MTNEWTKYSEDADALTKKTGSSSLDDLSGESNQFAAHLKGAISLLPELRERKTTIEAHMSILEAVIGIFWLITNFCYQKVCVCTSIAALAVN